MNILDAIKLIFEDNRNRNIPKSAPYLSPKLIQPMRTGYGTAMDEQTLDWFMQLRRMETEREMQRLQNEEMMRNNWNEQKWDWPYRGVDSGFGWGS